CRLPGIVGRIDLEVEVLGKPDQGTPCGRRELLAEESVALLEEVLERRAPAIAGIEKQAAEIVHERRLEVFDASEIDQADLAIVGEQVIAPVRIRVEGVHLENLEVEQLEEPRSEVITYPLRRPARE